MRLTVLGKSPSWQDAGGACSGYLLEEDGTAVVIDCGNGVFGKLRQRIDYVDVDAVVISHLHADHFLDLVPFSYALTYAPRQQPVPVDRWPGTDTPACPVLHVPPGARDTFRRVVGAWGNDDLIENAFELREYDQSSELEIGPVRVRFQPVPHFTETFAMLISSTNGSGRIVYGAGARPRRRSAARSRWRPRAPRTRSEGVPDGLRLSPRARSALDAICETFAPGGDGLPSATDLRVPERLLALVGRNPRAAERRQG